MKAIMFGFVAAGSLAASVLVPAGTGTATTPIPTESRAGPVWVAGANHTKGDIVKCSDGFFYIAERNNPGYNPGSSTYYSDPYQCGSRTGNPNHNSFVVSEAQFN